MVFHVRRKKIDDIDLKIIAELQQDGRIKLTDLADKLDLTHPSVYERLKKLIENNLIKIQANLNLPKLKLKAAFVFMNLENTATLSKWLEKCGNCSKLVLMGIGSGRYNLFVVFVGESFNELKSMIEKNLEGLAVKEVHVSYGEIIYPLFYPLRINVDCEKIVEEICSRCAFYKSKLCRGCSGILNTIKTTIIT